MVLNDGPLSSQLSISLVYPVLLKNLPPAPIIQRYNNIIFHIKNLEDTSMLLTGLRNECLK